MLKIRDRIGAIYKYERDGKKSWDLREDVINKIVITKNGVKYHTKSKFHPLDADEVDSNTEIQERGVDYILTGEVFCLNDITRPQSENWIRWANENMSKAVSILG